MKLPIYSQYPEFILGVTENGTPFESTEIILALIFCKPGITVNETKELETLLEQQPLEWRVQGQSPTVATVLALAYSFAKLNIHGSIVLKDIHPFNFFAVHHWLLEEVGIAQTVTPCYVPFNTQVSLTTTCRDVRLSPSRASQILAGEYPSKAYAQLVQVPTSVQVVKEIDFSSSH